MVKGIKKPSTPSNCVTGKVDHHTNPHSRRGTDGKSRGKIKLLVGKAHREKGWRVFDEVTEGRNRT
jgi:hypothetical protein